MNQIQNAIDVAGSATALAKALGVTPQAVCFWRDGKREIPADKCPLIERETGVRCELLRPDVAWNVLRESPVSVNQPSESFVAQGV
jgi:DNA-binding transcriptional regulator YdaS (Cro superfamily)